jgi:hypothetical protein
MPARQSLSACRTCVGALAGIAELAADKPYDTDPFRGLLKGRRINPSFRASPIAKNAFDTIRRLTRSAEAQCDRAMLLPAQRLQADRHAL